MRQAAATLALALLVAGCGDGRGTVTVLAASSLTDAFADVAAAFEEASPDVDVVVVAAGSNALVAQLADGAPADVLAVADPLTMATAAADGLIAGHPVVFARNRLRLVVPAGNPGGVTGLSDLADPGLLVGLCAPEVPCGRLAAEALSAAGIDAAVDTFEPSARSLLAKLIAGELDAGLVYATDAIGAGEAVAMVGDGGGPATDYPIALVAGSPSPAAADFIVFVTSPESTEILARHGFELP